MFATKGMYCVDCRKNVQIDTSKRSQCPDCNSLRVTEIAVNARSKSQAPAQVAGRHRRNPPKPAGPSRPAQGQTVSHSQAPRPTNTRQPIQRPNLHRVPPREETKHRPAVRPSVGNPRPRGPAPVRPQRSHPPSQSPVVTNPAVPTPSTRNPPIHELRRLIPPPDPHPPRPLIPEVDELDEDHEDFPSFAPVRRVRMIRISSPLEALELFHFLPQRQAAVLYFIMQGLGLFGVPRFEEEDGGLQASFEEFLGRIISTQPENVHPASHEFLERMETAKVTTAVEQKGEVCTICLSAFKVGECANRLPCKHIFHGECVMPWLRTNNTCPVCRQSVDGH